MRDGTNLPPGRRRRFLLVGALSALLVSLLVTELVVRVLFWPTSPDVIREHSLQYLPTVFARHMLQPDQTVDSTLPWGPRSRKPEEGRRFRINPMGYRGGPFPSAKPEGAIRVVVIGGSSVFDLGAEEGEDWPHLVEQELRRAGHPEVEVINAGVPGHASFDSLGRLYTQIWTFRPDFVLLYTGWNDIKIFGDLGPESPLIWHVQPYVATSDPFQNYRGALDRLLCLSEFYVKLRNRYFQWRLGPGPEGIVRGGGLRPGFDPAGVEQYRLTLEMFVDASRNIGALPILLTEATLVSEKNSPEERARINYAYVRLTPEALAVAYREIRRTTSEVAREKQSDFLDVAAETRGDTDCFVDHVHLSRKGARKVSGLVAEFLLKRLGRQPDRRP